MSSWSTDSDEKYCPGCVLSIPVFFFAGVSLLSGAFLSQKMARFHFFLCKNDKSFLVVPGTETEICKTLLTSSLDMSL